MGRSTALAVVLKKTPLLNARSGSMQTTIIGQTAMNTTAGLWSNHSVPTVAAFMVLDATGRWPE
jgi:hypothetical protein